MTLLVGQKLYGCEGWFGAFSRPSDEWRVEAVGVDWVVARDEAGVARFANDDRIHELLSSFKTPPEDGE